MFTKGIRLAFKGVGQGVRGVGRVVDGVGKMIQGDLAIVENLPLYNIKPTIGPSTFIAPSATVIGDTHIGQRSAIWYGTILRGDNTKISIGEGASIGDRTVISAPQSAKQCETKIGNRVTIGSGVILQGCTVDDGALIEMGAVILEGAVVGARSQVAPGSLVLAGTTIPPKQFWAGAPAVYVRDLTADELVKNEAFNRHYLELGDKHDYWHTLTPEQHAVLDKEDLLSPPPSYTPERLF